MRILALDLSTHTGYSVFNEGKLETYGLVEVTIKDMNFLYPEESKTYPQNLIDVAERDGQFS